MSLKHVAVIDYGMGNLRSVAKAAEHVANEQTRVFITQDPQDVGNADAIIFPGQGAAKACMQALADHQMVEAIKQAAQEKPFLGICMGLQVLMTQSDENQGVNCLNIIDGQVKRFDNRAAPEHKIPHMGWNQIRQTQDHPLWHQIEQDSRFYFVHSYYVSPSDQALACGRTNYIHPFCSAIAQNNLFAIQAHPEKSAQAGLQLLNNFLNWSGH